MTTDQHLNTGAKALGALPDDEALGFVEHLETCEVCSDELAGFLETAAILGSSVAQTPPASLRRSVMEAVARTPQLPPLTDPASSVVTPLGRHRGEADAPAGPTAPAVRDSNDVGAGTDRPPATVIPFQRPWYRRPQSLLAAAVAVLIIGGGTTVAVANRGSAPLSAAACVAAASDKSDLSPTVGSGGGVTLAPSCDAAVVKVPSLPAPPAGKVYQLWIMKGTNASAAVSVGVMNKNADGTYSAVTTGVHAGDSAVGVSVEPAPSGSAEPTRSPFWVVPLAS